MKFRKNNYKYTEPLSLNLQDNLHASIISSLKNINIYMQFLNNSKTIIKNTSKNIPLLETHSKFFKEIKEKLDYINNDFGTL